LSPSSVSRSRNKMAAVVIAVKHRNEERARNKERARNEELGIKSDPKPKPVGAQAKQTRNAAPDIPAQSYGMWAYQRKAALLYLDIRVQVFVACLIAANFLANIIEEWVDPAGTEHEAVWKVFDNMFNVLFSMELLLNMYGFWFRRFWKSAWNVFDFVVVSVGLLGLFEVPLPGPLGMLRMLRAFRVFRLFKRVKSLNKLMVTLAKAVPGVVNAFLIVVIVMCIYSILGVEFFSDYGADLVFTNEMGENVPLVTLRGLPFGDEYFGNFGKSLYTMFQVLTGESWSEVVARPLLHSNNPVLTLGVAFYFASFTIFVGIVLINVVVAVLLEKMVDNESEEQEEEGRETVETKTDAKAEVKAVREESENTQLQELGNASLTEMEGDMEELRRELKLVKLEIRKVAEVFETMEPVFTENAESTLSHEPLSESAPAD